MQKILLICHDIPSMTVGATLPIYHLIKNLGKQYAIHLISFDSGKYSLNNIINYLDKWDTLPIPEYLSIKDQLKYTAKNMLSLTNLHVHSFLNYYYRDDMYKLIKSSLDKENFDIIITDMPMAFYVKNSTLPRIVYAFDAVSNYNYNMYQKATGITSKIYWYLNYLKIHNYEKIYNKFNACIVVNNKDKMLLKEDIHTSIHVIPNGVDTSFFKNENKVQEPKLVFLGDMSTPPNNDAVKYFVENIYPLIIKEKEINFYIVGRNPSEYIQSLNQKKNIIVTGAVEDVRKYLEPGTIFITPMISGTGIKNKILEAMSMGLPVVSTSIGISGIDATNKKEFMLADDITDYKDIIIKLINDEKLRKNIGFNARIFVENNYSWKTSMKELDNIIQELT